MFWIDRLGFKVVREDYIVLVNLWRQCWCDWRGVCWVLKEEDRAKNQD